VVTARGRPVLLTEGPEDNPAPVLLSSDPGHPAVADRVAAGERVFGPPPAASGERILDAVAMMDKLRTDGPWESEQTHESLRRYLLEETYELFDAVRNGDAQELRQELGDVLLQVLFTPASPRTHPLTRSISTTSPTPWCASWTTAFRCARRGADLTGRAAGPVGGA
jgi:hypothetical protein